MKIKIPTERPHTRRVDSTRTNAERLGPRDLRYAYLRRSYD